MDNSIKDYIRLNFEQALHNGYITIYYEPVIRILTGKICAMEALARWDDPLHGRIPPHLFVPVLETCHKIHLLDHFVMKEVAKEQYRQLQRKLIQPPVILNLSRCDFALMDPCRELAALMEKYHLPHANFQIEITETALSKNEEIMAGAIHQLRAQGHPIILDNFGYGYSSLAALQRYAIDEISLDRNFFHTFNENSKKILTSIILMAKTLGIHVTAEGVKNEEQRQFLRDIGCEKMQGDYIHTVTPVADIFSAINKIGQNNNIETPAEGQIFKQAGLANLITDTPVGIILDDGSNFTLLAANKSYKNELHAAGIGDYQSANHAYRFLPAIMQERLRNLANQAIHSHQVEELTCIGDGQYFHLHVMTLAGTDGLYIHRAELRHLLSDHEARTDSCHYDHILRNLLQIYQDICLINQDKNRIDIIESSNAHYKSGKHYHGIMRSFLEYASLYIHTADRQRFLHFIRDLQQKKTREYEDTAPICSLFRVKQPNGSYRWKTFEIVSFLQESHLCQLLCLRDFLFEKQENKEELLRTFMASYGYTSFSGEKDNDLNDVHLWRTLMQFSHRKLFWKDADGRFCGASPEFLHFYGIENSTELIGKTDADIGWHISTPQMEQYEHTVLKKGIPIHNRQGYCISHGRQHAISFSKYPIYDGLNIIGLLGEFHDLEEDEKMRSLQNKLYLIDEETNFYNYRGMILASVGFADNFRLHGEDYMGAMLVIPEFDLIAKTYGSRIRKKLLLKLKNIIQKKMPPTVVAAYTGSGIFMLLQKNISPGEMRQYICQIEKTITSTTSIDGYACTLSFRYALAQGREARTSDEFLKIISERCLGTLPSFAAGSHHGDYIPFEVEKFDSLNRLIYIADPASYELIYINAYMLSHFGYPANFYYTGKKCYELLANADAPCADCPREKLSRDRFYFHKIHLPWTSKDYFLWHALIDWNGHQYIFSDGLDVSEVTQRTVPKETANVKLMSINDVISLAIRESDPRKGIMQILAKIGQSLAAEHVIIMEEDTDGFHLNCSYEWHNDKVKGIKDSLHHLSFLEAKPLYEEFCKDPILLIDDFPAYQHNHPELLLPYGQLKRAAVGHLNVGDQSFGYLAILNPAKERFSLAASFLQTAMHVGSLLIRNRDKLSHLHELSIIDPLTGIGNRLALHNYLQDEIKDGTSYAILFADINGLKKMNDTRGHKHGDNLIQTVADILTDAIGRDKVFRLGGDEFLCITPCENAIKAGNLLQIIENKLKARKVSAALGYVIHRAPFGDIDHIVYEADANMYRDKKRKHMTRDELE